MADNIVRHRGAVMRVACALALFTPGVAARAQAVATDARSAAATSHAKVTLDVTNTPLVDVLKQIARQAGLNPTYTAEVVKSPVRVTLRVHDVNVADAFERVLQGTPFRASFVVGGVTIVRQGLVGVSVSAGSIVGRVVDARTKQPLRGAMVLLDGTGKRVTTSDDGTFRFPNVTPGSHTVSVRSVGYVKITRPALVSDGHVVSLEIAMDASVNALDEVVVTGTIVATERKAVPNAITVITAKEIEQRGITRIDQLFKGEVPGLFAADVGTAGNYIDQVTMFSRGATALSAASAGTNSGTNPIKTYVDGIEMANPQYLSAIDPKSIERIEIVTGPQASTIYGSNAINGVMQIFTKRGHQARPELTLSMISGQVQNNISRALAPVHDDNAQINGIEGRFSYNTGGSWTYTGPWSPAKQTTRTSAFGGGRFELPTTIGRVTANVTLNRSFTATKQLGDTYQQEDAYIASGWYQALYRGSGLSPSKRITLLDQTFGATIEYAPSANWSHELTLGMDGANTDAHDTRPNYASPGVRLISGFSLAQPGDTSLSLTKVGTTRRSLRYSTTARVSLTQQVHAVLTAGADQWSSLYEVNVLSGLAALTGANPLQTTSTTNTRQAEHNTGAFIQGQVGVLDQLFFTYGLRAEWNPNYGAEALPSYAPRYGVAYTHDFGPVTAKIRGSYGKATRPPSVGKKGIVSYTASWGNTDAFGYLAIYGNYNYQLANPVLRPEYQSGGEVGSEIYLGSRASLVITRYNQTVNDLIDRPVVDSLRSPMPNPGRGDSFDADGYGYVRQYMNANIGSLRNQGWELQGNTNVGPLSLRGTYSWTKSRVIGVKPEFQGRRSSTGTIVYQKGSTFQYLPEHTWALGATYARAQSTVALTVTGIGQLANSLSVQSLQYLSTNIRLQQNMLRIGAPVGYVNMAAGYATADLSMTHRFSSHAEGVFQMVNLTDHYTQNWTAQGAVMGRQSKVGVRLKW